MRVLCSSQAILFCSLMFILDANYVHMFKRHIVRHWQPNYYFNILQRNEQEIYFNVFAK